MRLHSAWLTEDEDACYLNHASQVPLDPLVMKAGMRAIQSPPWEASEDYKEKVRSRFASLINAKQHEIAIMPSTAFAISLAAMNFSGKQGKVLLIEDQFNSAVYPWQRLCDTSDGNVEFEIVPYPNDGQDWTRAVVERLNDDVLVACLPPLHWSDGSLLDLAQISFKCREYNVELIVDATQAVGVMPLDVSKIQPTLLAASVHKWLRGPIGTSLVYLSPKVHDAWLPLDQHGRSRNLPKTWEATQHQMTKKGYPTEFVSDARKFDAGGKPNPILMPMVLAGLELVAKSNLQHMRAYLKFLVEPLLTWARSRGFSIPHKGSFHVVGMRPNNMTVQEMLSVQQRLEQDKIYIAVRCGAFRVSPFVNNKESDIRELLAGLDRYCPT